jgi:KaiC/GvpD/RAD55 family RecA-like ATPase
MFWQEQFVPLEHLTRLDAASSSEEIAQALDEVLRPPCAKGGRFPHPKVLFPILSPRSLRPTAAEAADTFQTRYEQIERLLRGFRWLRDHHNPEGKHSLPQLRMVCIDSLSALAERPLTREEIYRVFDLFTNYGVIGVATAEGQSDENADTMDYLADVVVELRAEHDCGYAMRYLEITKARHQHQVYGLHPFVVRNYREINGPNAPNSLRSAQERAFQAVMVYPSIHHTVASTRQNVLEGPMEQGPDPFDIGIAKLKNILTHRLPRGSIVAINGPRGTFKSHIARNFLLSGISKGESVLLLNLGEQEQFCPSRWRATGGRDHGSWLLSRDTVDQFRQRGVRQPPDKADLDFRDCLWPCFHIAESKGSGLGVERKNTAKFARRVWRFKPPRSDAGAAQGAIPVLVELDLKPGALLPEQFIKLVRDIFRQLDTYGGKRKAAKIRRIVLDDVSLIGTSYPFLRQSKTAGDLFLSAFAHMCRAYDTDLVILGTSGEFSEADGVVKRALTLADSVLTCNYCDVFGTRFIAVTGEGLMVGRRRDPTNSERPEYGEYVPGVIAPEEGGVFDVNLELLEGLVGFEQGRVHRPGLVVSVFSEGAILSRYNAEVRTMLERAFASPSAGHPSDDTGSPRPTDSDISVMEFNSGTSGPLHQSLEVLHGKPVDKTVVCALDEFFLSDHAPAGTGPADVLCDLTSRIHESTLGRFRREIWPKNTRPARVVAVPYYSNVLLVAYRYDLIPGLGKDLEEGRGETWSVLADAVERKLKEPNIWGFECGAWSGETLACVVLDLLLSSARSSDATSVRKLLAPPWGAGQLKDLSQEFTALARLFRHSVRLDHRLCAGASQAGPIPLGEKGGKIRAPDVSCLPSGRKLTPEALKNEIATYSQKLVCNSAVYLGWYSQLRELIDEHPELGPKLKVIALPGGGIRGDWYLGVVKGSVSVKLGLNIIEILTNKNEDNRRFIRGVGLPVFGSVADVGPKGSQPSMAWYRGRVPLSDVLKIHKEARSRSHFSDYQDIRETLAAIGEQIAFPVTGDAESVSELLRRLSRIVAAR